MRPKEVTLACACPAAVHWAIIAFYVYIYEHTPCHTHLEVRERVRCPRHRVHLLVPAVPALLLLQARDWPGPLPQRGDCARPIRSIEPAGRRKAPAGPKVTKRGNCLKIGDY